MDFLSIEARKRFESIKHNVTKRNRVNDMYFTLEEVAFVLGVTIERARQIEMEAMKKIRGIGLKIEDFI